MMNKILALFGFKIIKVSKEYDFLGKTYYFPLESNGTYIIDSIGQSLPFDFKNEEECLIIVNLFNMHSK